MSVLYKGFGLFLLVVNVLGESVPPDFAKEYDCPSDYWERLSSCYSQISSMDRSKILSKGDCKFRDQMFNCEENAAKTCGKGNMLLELYTTSTNKERLEEECPFFKSPNEAATSTAGAMLITLIGIFAFLTCCYESFN